MIYLKKVVLITNILILLNSCNSVKTLKYSLKKPSGKLVFLLDIPTGYKLTNFNLGHEQEYRMLYSDSSLIYLTDNLEVGARFNSFKFKGKNDDYDIKMLLSDSLDVQGFDNNRFWREKKLGNIVIGYYNVSINKKESYDSALNTIRSYFHDKK